jgi:serine/threonine protein kinase
LSPLFLLQWRAPEEYFEWNLDEKIDVFSLGNNFYGMLTGLEPLWEFEEEGHGYDKVKAEIKKGTNATIDPRFKKRSLAEAKLAEIIPQMRAYKPEDRPSIFEVVDFLAKAVEEVHSAGEGEEEHQR